MCTRDSSPEAPAKPPPKRTTRATTTRPTTTTAPTTTTQKPTTQPITSTPIQTNTKTTFHSTVYVDASTDPASKTTSLFVNRRATVSSARDGSMIEIGLVGAVIGGLLLLLVVALIFFFIYRQRRSKTQTDGSQRQDTTDPNVNGGSGYTTEMTSLPNYNEEQHADENVKPLYTQVNKKAQSATTAIEASRETEKSKGQEDTKEMVDNLLYETDSVPTSIVYKRPLEGEIPQTNGNQLGNTVSGTTLDKVQSRVRYENVETTTESNTYENQSDLPPESDWGSAYDKLDRLDHVIGNQKVIGENVYDM